MLFIKINFLLFAYKKEVQVIYYCNLNQATQKKHSIDKYI